MVAPKSIAVVVSRGELIPPEAERIERKDIGPGGARGLWDGFGTLEIRVGDRDVMILSVQENASGEVVVRATVPGDIAQSYGDGVGVMLDAEIEKSGLIAPDSTSRDRGWIKEN